MLESEDFEAFEEDFRKLFKRRSHSDLLVDYVVIASAIEPSSGVTYTTLLTPQGQRSPITAGLVRMGVIVSDRMLDDSTYELIDEDEEDD